MPDPVLRFDQDTQGDLDSYTLDFTSWLSTVPGDTIASASVTILPATMTIVGSATIAGGTVSQWLSGGVNGVDYAVSYHVTTASGRSVTRTAMLFCGTRPNTVTVATLGAKALRRLGVAMVTAEDRPGLSTTIAISTIATRALEWLAVIASDETPSATDQALAESKVHAIHDALVAQGIVSWSSVAIPQAVSEEYVMLTAMHLAPSFGKAGDPAQLPVIETRVRRVMALMGAQDEATDAVITVHADLVARGKARWTVFDIPVAAQSPYIDLAAAQLAPLFAFMGAKVDPADAMKAERDLARIIALESSGERVRAEYF